MEQPDDDLGDWQQIGFAARRLLAMLGAAHLRELPELPLIDLREEALAEREKS